MVRSVLQLIGQDSPGGPVGCRPWRPPVSPTPSQNGRKTGKTGPGRLIALSSEEGQPGKGCRLCILTKRHGRGCWTLIRGPHFVHGFTCYTESLTRRSDMGDTGSEGSKPPSNVNIVPPRCPCGFWGWVDGEITSRTSAWCGSRGWG